MNANNEFEFDVFARQSLEELKRFIEANGRLKRFKLDWQDGGVTNQDYINDFVETFTNECIQSIKNLKLKENSTLRQHKVFGLWSGLEINVEVLFKEVLHHWKFCEYKLKMFIEREEVFIKIKEYFKSTSRNRPLCLHASSGEGKTSLLAMLAKKLSSKWLNDVFTNYEPTIVIRFLGMLF